MNKSRLEAFSDGVLAIIITIMVLEIKVPHGNPDFNSLIPLLPIILSYVLSFIYIGIYWNNHHHMLQSAAKISGSVLWANLHLLFWLSLIPFATAWMGENHFEKNTLAAYALLADICGIAYYILLMVIKDCNRDNTALLELLRKQSKKGMLSCIIYSVAIGLSLINPLLGGILIVLVAIMWLIPDRNIERSLKE